LIQAPDGMAALRMMNRLILQRPHADVVPLSYYPPKMA
jgi:hypothetical protein